MARCLIIHTNFNDHRGGHGPKTDRTAIEEEEKELNNRISNVPSTCYGLWNTEHTNLHNCVRLIT